jgi:hypothetical protein
MNTYDVEAYTLLLEMLFVISNFVFAAQNIDCACTIVT